MGQYYLIVNLDKKQYLHPHKCGDGLKLLEFGCSANGTLTALAILLADGNNRGGGDLRSDHPIIGSWAGDPEARETLAKLKAMQRDDPDEEVRTACSEAIRSLEAGTQLYGLRRELNHLSAARASLRKETLRRLIQDSEVTP